ncbi:MAG: hypothetical protein ACI8WB_002360 [Phenylobacterium sp.]|jgi:hypothetical protein
MKKNYMIDQAIAVHCETLYFDLHNEYDFKQFNFKVDSKTLSLLFEPNIYASNDNKKLGGITMIFSSVDYLEVSHDFVNHVTHSLIEMGYKTPNDKDLDWLITEKNFEADHHVVLRFSNDEYIRLHCLDSIISTK